MNANSASDIVQHLLDQANEAYRRGDRMQARRLLFQVRRLDPNNEQLWLILGYLAAPTASRFYFQKALDLNPHNEAAQKGHQWANGRLPLPEGQTPTRPVRNRLNPVEKPVNRSQAPSSGVKATSRSSPFEVCLISSLRKPFSSFLLLIVFGLISFGFITKAIEFILVQRETGVLGSYYRSIGVLENSKDPKSGDVSAGINLIKTSLDFGYGDQREVVSGVMAQTYNSNGSLYLSNSTPLKKVVSKEDLPDVHTTDLWFIGELTKKEEVKTKAKLPQNQITIGYYLEFDIDTLYAAYPELAQQGQSSGLIFLFEGNEAAIPTIQAMAVGQRYFIHGWEDVGVLEPDFWVNAYGANLQIIPLNDQPLWYMQIAKGASLDFSTPEMATIKNEIDILNENLHTLNIIATTDMSGMPRTQETSHYYFLTEGRWLNHQDDLAGNKVIVVSKGFADMRGFKLGDSVPLTFRPLKDTYYGYIRDGIDSISWRSYPTYQDTLKIVGIYSLKTCCTIYAYIPASILRPGFASATQNQFRDESDYSFALVSSRYENEFTQAYKDRLQSLGISLTFLPNNGPAFWATVDPIRRSSTADVLVFGALMLVALILAVFLYLMARKKDYAILRVLGVPVRQANGQLILPLLLISGLGILIGGVPSWQYALNQAKATLSTLPTPSGVTPSADLSPFILAGLCIAIFLILAMFTWLGVLRLAHTPVYELVQGQASRLAGGQKLARTAATSQPFPPVSSGSTSQENRAGSLPQAPVVNQATRALRRKYTPFSLSQYVIKHVLRSRLKSMLTLAVALGFMLASGWLRQTIEGSHAEIDRLYDTTVVEADIAMADPSAQPVIGTIASGSGFVYLKTVDRVLNSGFVKSSVLESDTNWETIETLESHEVFTGPFLVDAYDRPATLYSSLADPGTLMFATGWDQNSFAKQWTLDDIQKDGFPALFPMKLIEEQKLKVGETVRITDIFNSTYTCIIAGQYSGETVVTIAGSKSRTIGSAPILIPLSALESMERSKTTFTVAHFSLDPKKNRELAQFQMDMDKAVKDYGAGTGDLRFIIWDEELRIVINQLEKNISLLSVLYPVLIAVSVLIGAGLCFLLLLQATREAAILRVLGTPRTVVQLALIAEPLLLSIIGVIIGLGISRLLWVTSDLVPAVPLWTGAGLYLAGALAGLVTGATSVTHKKPIELLQVKE